MYCSVGWDLAGARCSFWPASKATFVDLLDPRQRCLHYLSTNDWLPRGTSVKYHADPLLWQVKRGRVAMHLGMVYCRWFWSAVPLESIVRPATTMTWVISQAFAIGFFLQSKFQSTKRTWGPTGAHLGEPLAWPFGCFLPGRYWCQWKVLVSMTIQSTSGSYLDHSGLQLELLPWSSLSHPDLKELLCVDTMTLLWSELYAVRQFWLTFWLSMNLARDPTLDCVIHQHVGEPTHLSLSTAGKYAGKLYATMGNYWYKPNLRNIPTSSWRGTEWSGG